MAILNTWCEENNIDFNMTEIKVIISDKNNDEKI